MKNKLIIRVLGFVGLCLIVACSDSSSTSNPAVDSNNLPGAPIIGSATATNGSASVSFTEPSSTGVSPVTSYIVTSSPEGLTATGTSSPITISGLTNGTTYTFTVAATNSAGTGAASLASNSAKPITSAAVWNNGSLPSSQV